MFSDELGTGGVATFRGETIGNIPEILGLDVL